MNGRTLSTGLAALSLALRWMVYGVDALANRVVIGWNGHERW